jgi:hypothetical protein
MSYKQKYLKYKQKYINLKSQFGGLDYGYIFEDSTRKTSTQLYDTKSQLAIYIKDIFQKDKSKLDNNKISIGPINGQKHYIDLNTREITIDGLEDKARLESIPKDIVPLVDDNLRRLVSFEKPTLFDIDEKIRNLVENNFVYGYEKTIDSVPTIIYYDENNNICITNADIYNYIVYIYKDGLLHEINPFTNKILINHSEMYDLKRFDLSNIELSLEITSIIIDKKRSLKYDIPIDINKDNRQILVFGGAENIESEIYYGAYYFTIGRHPTAHFGNSGDWRSITFWDDLDRVLTKNNNKFKAVITDYGTEAFLQILQPFYKNMSLIIKNHLIESGVYITSIYTDPTHKFKFIGLIPILKTREEDEPIIIPKYIFKITSLNKRHISFFCICHKKDYPTITIGNMENIFNNYNLTIDNINTCDVEDRACLEKRIIQQEKYQKRIDTLTRKSIDYDTLLSYISETMLNYRNEFSNLYLMDSVEETNLIDFVNNRIIDYT